MVAYRPFSFRWFVAGLATALLGGLGWWIVPACAAESKTDKAPFRDEPAARDLYDRLTETLNNAHTLSYTAHLTWQGKALTRCTYKVWLKKPNYFRIETSLEKGWPYKGGVAIGDGKAMWFFWPKGRWKDDNENAEVYERARLTSYMKFPFAIGTDHFIGTHGLIGANPVLNPGEFFGFTKFAPKEVDGMRSLPAEKVNGQQCERIEASFMKHEESWCFWLSTQDHLPRRIKRVIRSS